MDDTKADRKIDVEAGAYEWRLFDAALKAHQEFDTNRTRGELAHTAALFRRSVAKAVVRED